MKTFLAILLLCIAAKESDFVTTEGVHERFDGKLTLKVYEQDGKFNYRVCRNVPEEKSESGPVKPNIEKGSKWFIFAETYDEVWIYNGSDILILRPFHDRRPNFPNGGFYQLKGKEYLDIMPKAVRDRLPDSFKKEE